MVSLLQQTRTFTNGELSKIFNKLSCDSKRIIRSNVPFFVRWFCSKSTMLVRYVCQKSNPPGGQSLQATVGRSGRKNQHGNEVPLRRPPQNIVQSFPPSGTPPGAAPRMSANPGQVHHFQAAGHIQAEGRTRLANATSLTFVSHDGNQYTFKDQGGQEVTVKSSVDLPRMCPKLRTLNFRGCNHLGRAHFQGFRALETVDFTDCPNLNYVDVSGCSNLTTLTLSKPLPPTPDGKAALIANGSPNLIAPEDTWFLSAQSSEFMIRHGGSSYRYGRSTGNLLKVENGNNGWGAYSQTQTPDESLLPLKNPHWKSLTEPPSPMPVPSSGIKPQQPADASAPVPQAQPAQTGAVQGPAPAGPVSADENARRLANATELKFVRTEMKTQNGWFQRQQKIYILTDQNGQEVEVNDFTKIRNNAFKLTTINMSGSDINSTDAGRILARETLNNADFSNCSNIHCITMEEDEAASSALKSLNLSGSGLSHITLIGHTKLTSLDLSGNANLLGVHLSGCTGLSTLNLSDGTRELRVLDVSQCTNLHALDLSQRHNFLEVRHTNCPAEVPPPVEKPVPPPEETVVRQLMNGAIGENWDRFNERAETIDFADLQDPNGQFGGRPKVLLPFIQAHHAVKNPFSWQSGVHTAPGADIYVRHDVSSSGGNAEGDAYFARITDNYCLTNSPLRQDTENFFKLFAGEIGSGTGMLVDLHCHQGEYLGTTADYTKSYITDVQQIGATITIPNATVFDAHGEQKTVAEVTITVHKAKVHGKSFFHVRVKGLPDNYAFSTQVQQQINAEVERIRQENNVTLTVSHCNGGMGRGPTQMYMDTIERVAMQARVNGRGCVCDWDNQKSPMINGKVNLAYVARNIVLTGHAARHVCGQSTSQFLQLKQFTGDIAREYDSGGGGTQPQAAQPQGVQGVTAAAMDLNATRLAEATSLTFVRYADEQYTFKDQGGQEVTVKSSRDLPQMCPNLKTLNFCNCDRLGQAHLAGFSSLETLDFTECNSLVYVDVSNCPQLKTLTLPKPLQPIDGQAALIAQGSPNLIFPEKTWFLSNNGPMMKHSGAFYRYSTTTGVLHKWKPGDGTLWSQQTQTPDESLLPLNNPNWTSSSPMLVPMPRTLPAQAGTPAPAAAKSNPSAAPVATAAATGPGGSPEAQAAAMMHKILGGDFDKYNGDVDNINPADLTRKNDSIIAPKMPRPKAMVSFLNAHHPKDRCPNVFFHFCLHTKPEYSLYVRHRGKVGSESFVEEILENKVESYENKACQADYNQITDGDRSYYLTCAPNQLEKQTEFFKAFAAELGDEPGLIVDLHSDDSVHVKTNDYLTENPPDGLTDLETVADINLDTSIRIQIRKAKIDGKTFYHARVHNWADNTALNSERISQINAEIEKLCVNNAIRKVTIHCNGGLGRAPTMMYSNAIERIAKEAKAQGMGCCCNWDNQTQPMVDGKVNLAYVMRNMLLTGHAIRSTCGQSKAQFEFYKTFTEEMAARYADAA
jgi:protein tyrosine phosphatase